MLNFNGTLTSAIAALAVAFALAGCGTEAAVGKCVSGEDAKAGEAVEATVVECSDSSANEKLVKEVKSADECNAEPYIGSYKIDDKTFCLGDK